MPVLVRTTVTLEAATSQSVKHLVTIGETLALLTSPATGLLRHAPYLSVGVGGAESNVAIGMHRLGIQAIWIGRVGADEFGKRVVSCIRGEGVTVGAIIDPVAPTGLMIKERRTGHVTRILYYRQGSAGSRLSPADVDEQAVRQASVLHVTGITPALSSDARSCIFSAVEIACEARVPVSLDFNYRSRLWSPDEASPVLRDLTRRADLIFTGADEARLVAAGGTDEDVAKQLSSLGPEHVVIKRGALGSIGVVHGELIHQPAVPTQVVDTVGAGDAFVAGYLSQFVSERGPVECLSTASIAGAFAVSVASDWEGLPELDELGLLERTSGDVVR